MLCYVFGQMSELPSVAIHLAEMYALLGARIIPVSDTRTVKERIVEELYKYIAAPTQCFL